MPYQNLRFLRKRKKQSKVVPITSVNQSEVTEQPKKGNNGAKRKVYELEEVFHEVDPSDDLFNKEQSVFLFSRDIIIYTFIPPRLIKNIYRINRYRQGDNMFEGNAPAVPFLNSNFDSPVIANLIQ